MCDKYKDLYLLAKEVHAEEIRRFDLVTQKATWFLSVLSVLLGIAAILAKWTLSTILPPTDYVAWLLLLSGAAVFVFLALAWFSSFSVLRGQVLSKMPLDADVLNFFDSNQSVDIYYALSKRYSEGHALNLRQTGRRAELLAAAHRQIVLAAVSFVTLCTLSFVYVWNHPLPIHSDKSHGGSIMSENDQKSPQPPKVARGDAAPAASPADPAKAPTGQQPASAPGESGTPTAPSGPKPDKTVLAPPMQLLTHGADDSAGKKIIVDAQRPEPPKPTSNSVGPAKSDR